MTIVSMKLPKGVGVAVGTAALMAAMAPSLLGLRGTEMIFRAIFAVFGAVSIVAGFVMLRFKRMIENTPSSKVRSVAMGLAELKGVARARTPLQAPFSGMPCVYYRFTVEQEERGGRGGRSWRVVDQGVSGEPFFLEDDTGRILVDPAGAKGELRRDYRRVARDGGLFSHRKRYTEYRLDPGEPVYVLGSVRMTRDEVRERREELSTRLRELKHDPQRLQRFDTDRDGRISEEEWARAVRAVEGGMLRETLKAAGAPPEDDRIVGKGSEETTFLISDRTEASLVRSLAWKTALAFLLGVGLLGGVAARLLHR
jgi:E3 Ubiquitin ligase